MRIAVAGTHCSGKSTLIADFLDVHRDFAHEPEPYDLVEDADFRRQLELCVETLCGYEPGARVILERSPLDFLAYLGDDVAASDIALATRGLARLDLIAVLPLDGSIDAPEDEDLELRAAMNERLLEWIDSELLTNGPRVIEVHGSRRERLAALTRMRA